MRISDWSSDLCSSDLIPIIHCPDCGPVPVPEKDLPVVLPDDLIPDGSGNPLTKHEGFLSCHCPKCGTAARRETETMDTFVDSRSEERRVGHEVVSTCRSRCAPAQ